eukprot:CAMPEP_0202865738 /NCGR_PEP_ID=MMETSP1391-20130828/6329_1 /ASSEMBLY_ACC=CAM_ASM_000867 /TAXON_ID=1034604 /ORGANISM="Chlamydomonas leiostraca, Strain SAG 11-49" /LENGTH=162 /DNA_ID=CAMNT_0049545615 /DNA_START=120 /DNA_END=609 /DNA_ORIENTATION=+
MQRACIFANSNKGFGGVETSNKAEPTASSSNASSSAADEGALEALEARMRSRRNKKVEPKVKVESAVVDAVTGKGPAPPTAQAETTFITGLMFLFGVILLEGLLIAGTGFLPEEWDAFVTDVLYPGYTPTVFSFLMGSTAYGLWKIGKLPLPFLGAPPPSQD